MPSTASLLASGILVTNYLSLALMDPDPLVLNYVRVGYVVGSVYTQTSLAAAWAGLGAGRLVYRLVCSFLWIVALPVALALAFGIYGGPEETVLIMAWCVMGQWLFVQAILAPLSWRTGLHLARPESSPSMREEHAYQFGILDMMILMGVSAAALAIGRALLPGLRSVSGETPVFIFLAIAAVLMQLPLLLSVFLRRLAIAAVGLALLLIGLGTYFELSVLKELTSVPGPNMVHLISINATSILLILGVAVPLRFAGYRLRRNEPAS